MKTIRLLLLLAFPLSWAASFGQNTIYAYAVGDWRNGPVVKISPLFETTEMMTTPELINWVRDQWPQTFTDSTDIDVLRFATLEEGNADRKTLQAKYGMRKLEVNLMEVPEMPRTPARP